MVRGSSGVDSVKRVLPSKKADISTKNIFFTNLGKLSDKIWGSLEKHLNLLEMPWITQLWATSILIKWRFVSESCLGPVVSSFHKILQIWGKMGTWQDVSATKCIKIWGSHQLYNQHGKSQPNSKISLVDLSLRWDQTKHKSIWFYPTKYGETEIKHVM